MEEEFARCQMCRRTRTLDEIVMFFKAPGGPKESDCTHLFCNLCFRNWIKNLPENRRLKDIKCPDSKCTKRLDHRWLLEMHKSIVNEAPSYSKLHNYLLIQREPHVYRHCTDHNCYGVIVVDEEKLN